MVKATKDEPREGRSVRISPEAYAELVRRQTERFQEKGSRATFTDLIDEAVLPAKRESRAP